ncbi:MaoC/PaaZ C-terminal domain-containing protein [Cryobacterium aureum]|uniref:MaoC/PaaZ C-terminal domain-containing protein n=1 Tax=Cryobacterium aureum TaxID=995037 RepID=UPI0013749BBA|nr:MaoC/PaaZ C-terminal domain-containing protein [Cryobacterium aureum]
MTDTQTGAVTLHVLAEKFAVRGRAGFQANVGQEFVLDSWHLITQEAIDAFETACEEPGARGQPVVPGFMTLGLTVKLFFDTFDVQGFGSFLNYGVNRMRLPHPLMVGERVRARVKIMEVREVSAAIDVVTQLVFERDGAQKPVCWAEWIGRGYETRTHPGQGCTP